MKRVYRFGLRAPTFGERLVREQLRAAHEYRNDLVSIERGRRAALRAIESESDEVKEAEALVRAATRSTRRAALRALYAARKRAGEASSDELAAIAEREHEIMRDARALTPCFWGTYLDIEQAHRQSRGQPLYGDDGLEPNDPAYARGPRWRDALPPGDSRGIWWRAEGQVGIQLQGGLSVADALACGDTRLRLEMRPAEQRGRRYGTLWLRVGSDGRDPIWARWPLKMHRALPDAAQIKWARVSVRPEADWERWSLELTVDDPTPRVAAPSGHGAIAIEWEWSPLDDGGIRVARWADSHTTGAVVLPASIANGIRKPNGIRAVRDLVQNDMRDRFVRAVRDVPSSPRELVEAANVAHLWKSPSRFVELVMRCRLRGVDPQHPAMRLLAEWDERERHLYRYEAGARGEALRERREFYRLLARRWRDRYSTVLISGQNLSRAARWGDDSDVRFVAGCSALKAALENAFGEAAIKARYDAADESDVNRCERWIAAWDAGGTRIDEMFAKPKEKVRNAWAERKKKKQEKLAQAATAREPVANHAE